VAAIHAVTSRAFADRTEPAPQPGPVPVEATLVDQLRADAGWIPELSLVADDGGVIGHVVCTRATVAGRPALGLGPLSVDPPHQGRGVGSALMHAVLGAADALGEPLVVLLGNPRYYRRFAFVQADRLGIEPPVPAWGPSFQARPLTAYDPSLQGPFRYAEPFEGL